MPRVNNNAQIKDANGSNNVNVGTTKVRKRAIKKEVESPGEQNVFHRKSERRRVARDIFLVFEEQPCRRGRGGGANKKKTAQKPKFGHLMVEDPCRTKGLLRDIKNEPKSFNNDECTTTNTAPAVIAPPVVATKEEKKKNTPKANSRVESKPIVNALQLSDVTPTAITNEKTSDPVARVNPIFLWVKQDDTRIVEVRCEDYDKRNRIRITKTTNGWRAIPRTDPTTSKIVKILQTPLLKVKREVYENNLLQKCNESFSANLGRKIIPADVNEKQSFVTESVVENILSCNNNNYNGINNNVVSKESDQIVNNTKVKHKKTKNKKEAKKNGRKSTKLSIPKEELQTEINEECVEEINDLKTRIGGENQIEGCRAPIEQMIQSNLETIPNFSELSIKDHNIIAHDDTDSNNLTDAIESHSEAETQAVASTSIITTTKAIGTSTIIESSKIVPAAEKETETEIETETYQHHTPHLQLCPKTGLFLPNITNESDNEGDIKCITVEEEREVTNFNTNFLPKDILVDLVDCDDDEQHRIEHAEKLQPHLNTHYSTNNIDADTKNLKDLLDEADLMQHCNDNANSDADIIDSIVKRSCENNLIQETETLKEAIAPTTFTHPIAIEDSPQKDLMENVLSQHIIDDAVRDSPKCLSFNEAGEIEGLNGELFQTNHFMDSYEKESSVEEVCLSDDGGKKMETTIVAAITASPVALKEKENDDIIMEETPKDLSYKKREEVCPPSESRSQCAVTSSSDIVKSPQQGELPAIETTSEAIKNLILEQFIKLNGFNSISTNTVAKPQQLEPINLGKPQRNLTRSIDSNNYATSTNYIETVVIDDNSDDEPMKKRVRNTVKANNKNNIVEETPVPPPVSMPVLIDKDPDPLTQLQLLIRNTQWKVPDPILVPKDRLRAVLASPAREIPLLITTRPELRLPEAFAYPEIIQNPNILVISMAQLEAILKNEMEIEKSKQQNVVQEPIHDLPIENAKKSSPPILCAQSNKSHIDPPKSVKVKEPTLNPLNPMNQPLPPSKCSHVENNLASDINAATLAVLNQMLWLPYFGQLSQEFLKTLKNPLGVQQNKYAGLLPPIYNHHLGLQHLDEMYKNYLKQMTALKHLSADASVNSAIPNFPLSLGAFQPTMEATVFQKMLQHQLSNFLNINPLATAAASTPGSIVGKSPAHDITPNVEHMIAMEEKKSKINATATAKTRNTTPDIKHASSIVSDSVEKSLRNNINNNINNNNHNTNNNNMTISCDNVMSDSVNFNKYAYVQKQEIDNKPRLTCKSLSNLLEPESVSLSPAIPLVNLTTDHVRNTQAHELAITNSQLNTIINNKDTNILPTPAIADVMPFKSAKLNKVSNLALNAHAHSSHELLAAKQRKRTMNYPETAVVSNPAVVAAASAATLENHQVPSRNTVVDNMNAEPNQALWHPLFGSNAKTGYSSPWQWTTVTATGE